MMEHEEGFTIQEVLVTIVVGSLLVGFSLSAFLFVNKLYQSWRGKSELQGEIGRAVHIVTLDVLRSKAVTVSDSILILDGPNGRRIQYTVGRSGVFRDGVKLIPDDGIHATAMIDSLAADSLIDFAVTGTWGNHVIDVPGKSNPKKSSRSAFRKEARNL